MVGELELRIGDRLRFWRIGYALLYLLAFFGSRWLGLEWTAHTLRRIGSWIPPRHSRKVQAADLENRLAQSYRRLPIPVRCLEQSLVTWFVLNTHGHPARMRIGMSLSPLQSHAWVEAEGKTYVGFAHIPDLKIIAEYPSWTVSS